MKTISPSTWDGEDPHELFPMVDEVLTQEEFEKNYCSHFSKWYRPLTEHNISRKKKRLLNEKLCKCPRG